MANLRLKLALHLRRCSHPVFYISASSLFLSTMALSNALPVERQGPAGTPNRVLHKERRFPWEEELGVWQTLQLSLRCVWLCLLFLPAALLSGLAYALGQHNQSNLLTQCRDDALVWALCVAGPVPLQLAGLVSCQRRALPPSLCARLQLLLLEAPEHSAGYTRQQLEQGRIGEAARVELEDRPVSSGAFGQVHKGVLRRDQGQLVQVAVKVLHPGVRQSALTDLRLLHNTAQFLSRVDPPALRWLGIPFFLEELTAAMYRKLDLRLEAEALTCFRQRQRLSGSQAPNLKGLVFAEPVAGLPPATDVLVTHWEEGVTLAELFSPRLARGRGRFPYLEQSAAQQLSLCANCAGGQLRHAASLLGSFATDMTLRHGLVHYELGANVALRAPAAASASSSASSASSCHCAQEGRPVLQVVVREAGLVCRTQLPPAVLRAAIEHASQGRSEQAARALLVEGQTMPAQQLRAYVADMGTLLLQVARDAAALAEQAVRGSSSNFFHHAASYVFA
eukprot:g22741.t1